MMPGDKRHPVHQHHLVTHGEWRDTMEARSGKEEWL